MNTVKKRKYYGQHHVGMKFARVHFILSTKISKIASASLTDENLLIKHKNAKIPIILSTGMILWSR